MGYSEGESSVYETYNKGEREREGSYIWIRRRGVTCVQGTSPNSQLRDLPSPENPPWCEEWIR